MKWQLIILLSICLLHACKTKEKLDNNDSLHTQLDFPAEEDHIMTLILEFSLDTMSSHDQIELSNKIVSPGLLKKESHGLSTDHLYQLIFYNNANHPVKRISLPDPLRKRVEHSNEEGQISMSDITLDRDAVAIRMKYSREISKLMIYRLDASQLILINSFEL